MNIISSVVRYPIGYLIVLIKYISGIFLKYFRNDDLWVFFGSSDDEFSGNSKYMFLQVSREYESIKPIWLTKSQDVNEMLNENGFCSFLVYEPKGIYYMLKSGIFVSSISFSLYYYGLSGGATLVQLWHGVPLKSISSNRIVKYNPWYLIKYNYLVVNSKLEEEAFTDLRYEKLIVTGYPRNDIFYSDIPGQNLGVNSQISQQLEEFDDDTTLLGYFPTWRQYGEDKIEFDLEVINKLLRKNNLYMLFKPHRYDNHGCDRELSNIILHPPSGDPYPLLKEIDVLITDYSSIALDYLHTDGRIIYYVPDYETYKTQRGFYLEFNEFTPGEKVESFADLRSLMSHTFEDDRYTRERSLVRDQIFKYTDGKSTKRIMNAIHKSQS